MMCGNGEDNTEDTTILRDQGRGRHTIVLAPQRRGHFRVAVAVHNRWSRTIVSTRTSSLGRGIAVGLQMRNGLNMQVISAHIPSAINMKFDEVELHIQDVGNLVAGLRRHRIIAGIDANVHVGTAAATSSTSGTALGRATQGHNFLAGMLCNELGGRRLRLLNTFDSWWRAAASSTSAASSSAPASAQVTRSTWTGHLFGALSHRPLDCLIADVITAQRVDATYFHIPLAYPSEHNALGASYDLVRDIGIMRSRPVAKPIGWWPMHMEEYDSNIMKDIETLKPQTVADITNIIKSAAASVARTRRKTRRPGRSDTEDALRSALRLGSTPPEQRRALLDTMWVQRHRIAAENTAAAASSILRDLRAGGWGARHLTRSCAPMPHLDDQGSKVVDSRVIDLNAHAYYSDLFSPPPEGNREDDAQLAQDLREERVTDMCPESCFSEEDVARARLSLRRYKTCGDDGVVPEMILATPAADWRWSVAFNRRILNIHEDPGGAIADESWDRFRIRALAKEEAPTLFKLLRPIAVLRANAKLWSRSTIRSATPPTWASRRHMDVQTWCKS